MDHLGAALGPVLALTFLHFWPGEHRTLFLLTLIPGLAVLVLLLIGLKEVPKQQHAAAEFQWSLRPFDGRFRRYLAALGLFTLGNSSDLFLLWHAQQLGMPATLLPLLWFAFHIAKSGGNLLAGGWVDQVGPRPLLFAGWLIYALTYLLFGLAAESWQIWPLFLLYSLYFALAEPAEKTLVTLLAPAGAQGPGLRLVQLHDRPDRSARQPAVRRGIFRLRSAGRLQPRCRPGPGGDWPVGRGAERAIMRVRSPTSPPLSLQCLPNLG